jgi:hypothetical protein
MFSSPHVGQESAKLPVATGKSGQFHGRDASGVAQRATPEDETTLAELHGSQDKGSRLRKIGQLTKGGPASHIEARW